VKAVLCGRWSEVGRCHTHQRPSGRGITLWPQDALRIGFGIIWLIDTKLVWLPGFQAG
jgi:hypothetical protein